MVKFQIMSDLHLECIDQYDTISDFILPSAEVLILAGDIGRIHRYSQVENFLKQLCPYFDLVLYVLGNHEYYSVDGIENRSMDTILEDVHKIAKNIPNLHILNRDSVIIDDICITGCTLWSYAINGVPPFIVKIPGMNSCLYNTLYNKDLEYIEKVVDYCQEKKYKLLVVTHHCPTYEADFKRKRDRFKSLYYSNLDYLLKSDKVHTWICGHTHINFDFLTRGGTRLVSNQRGKVRDNITDYSLDKVISM